MDHKIIIDDLFENYEASKEQRCSRRYLLEIFKNVEFDKCQIDVAVKDGLIGDLHHPWLIKKKNLKFYILENGQIIVESFLRIFKNNVN